MAEGASPDPSITQQTTKIASTGVVIPLREDRYAPGVVVEQKYALVRLLGEGGMGSVWVARNLTLNSHVALKLMRTDFAQAVPGAGERMLQEARAAAAIHHPAIVQIFDFGRTRDGDPFISMELLDGESLSAALKRRERLPALRAVQVLLPIADALVVAHARGVVHRDLKPDNVLLARLADGRVQPKILDFGIAKLDAPASPKLTLDGTVLGSPAYMSPEQARGQSDIDLRVDVWAFSVMLYELVTGCTPFAGESYNALLYAIMGQEPLSLAEHGVNEPELWAILARGLDKNRDTRFPTMRALGRALAEWLLDRKVKVDITQAPLRPWLEASERPAPKPSLFASLLPSGELSDPPPDVQLAPATAVSPMLDLLREGIPSTEVSIDHVRDARAKTTVGRRAPKFDPGYGPVSVASKALGRMPRWGWFALPAAIAFMSAVLASRLNAGPSDEVSAGAPPHATASAVATVAPTPLPATTAVAATSRPEPAPPPPAPVLDAAPPAKPVSVVVKPARVAHPAPPRPAPHRAPSRAELKNPFH
ncbi:MAG TPA: serine/threonine-protein kinase [Polyangiaceae bacterium]|nr:serine/threonine-protein kinase [Polyangiaceae bacterium]